jgi:hypothetical protein
MNKISVKAKFINKKNNSIEITNFFSILARKIFINGNEILIQRASVADNTYNRIYFSFMDIIYDQSNLNSFVRIYNNNLFVYENSEIVYSQKRKKSSYFKTLKKDQFLSDKFITMDLETKSIEGVLEPYCVSLFDGKKSFSFYITDYENSSDLMLKASIKFLLKRKFNKYKIYVHNFSHFDGIFLMKIISEIVNIKNIKPIIRDNRIISLKLNFLPENKQNNNNYYIEFRDSYLLLTASLDKLGKTFSLNKGKYETKLPFPYKFINEPNIKYNYIGEFPSLKYFENINSYKIFLNNLNKENIDK